jgi:hypothetical protein
MMRWVVNKDGDDYELIMQTDAKVLPKGYSNAMFLAGPNKPKDELKVELQDGRPVIVDNVAQATINQAYSTMDANIISSGIQAFGTNRIDSMTFFALGMLCRAIEPQRYLDAGAQFNDDLGDPLDTAEKMRDHYFAKLVQLDLQRMSEIATYLQVRADNEG